MATTNLTRDRADNYVGHFRAFLREKVLCESIENVAEETLADFLRYLYHSSRGNGQLSSPSTLSCGKAGIHRYLIGGACERSVDILRGPAFVWAYKMTKTVANM